MTSKVEVEIEGAVFTYSFEVGEAEADGLKVYTLEIPDTDWAIRWFEHESLKLQASKLAGIESKRGLELSRLRQESRILSVILADVSEALGAGDHESPVSAARRVRYELKTATEGCVELSEAVASLTAGVHELDQAYQVIYHEGREDGMKRNADLLEQSRAVCTRRTSELEAMRPQLEAALLRVSELNGAQEREYSALRAEFFPSGEPGMMPPPSLAPAYRAVHSAREAIAETDLPQDISSATAIRTLWSQLQAALLRCGGLRAEPLAPESEGLPPWFRRVTDDDMCMSFYREITPTHYRSDNDEVMIDGNEELCVRENMDDGMKVSATVSVCAAKAVIEAYDRSRGV